MARTPVVKVIVDKAALGTLTSAPEAKALLHECAEHALDFQRSAVPIDSRALEKSLGIRENTDGTLDIGSVLLSINKRTKQDARDYSLAVEEGHHTKSGTFVAAQPYIRPSINAAKKGLGN
jgi:hypothetical protein